ncbi:MAG: hypothetical protein QOG72_3325 [Sphingomonadales bacterium]|jgi:hypothetical protein|nr:hypothetical protein [Sphingomonadales bacterium]
MIIFDLKCAPQGHVFEAWFGSTAAYEEQRARGLVGCPVCGSAQVAKAPMAPAVGAKGNASLESISSGSSPPPDEVKSRLAEAAALQKKLLEGSEAVGERFADEARAIHLGDSEARSIHGLATRAEAESLIDEGVPIAPLPFPVAEPGAEN